MYFHWVKLIQVYSCVEEADVLSIASSARVIRRKWVEGKSGVGMECLMIE